MVAYDVQREVDTLKSVGKSTFEVYKLTYMLRIKTSAQRRERRSDEEKSSEKPECMNKFASLALRLSPWQDHGVLRRRKAKSASYA